MIEGLILTVLGAGAWFLVPHALRALAERRLARQCRRHRAIVLSYDDGPGATLTQRLIELLDRHGARATFFVLGRNAEAAPEVLARLRDAGHEIGSHTYDHSNAWKTGPLRMGRDVARGVALVDRLGGDATLFRPPFGKLTLGLLVVALRRGLRLGWWTVDTRDSWARRPVEEVLAEIEAAEGGVVLMHDYDSYVRGARPGDASHADHVIALTERILRLAAEKDYRVMPLGALLRSGQAA